MCAGQKTSLAVHSQELPTLFSETRSLTKPEAHRVGQAGWSGGFGNPLIPASPVLGLQARTTAPTFKK